MQDPQKPPRICDLASSGQMPISMVWVMSILLSAIAAGASSDVAIAQAIAPDNSIQSPNLSQLPAQLPDAPQRPTFVPPGAEDRLEPPPLPSEPLPQLPPPEELLPSTPSPSDGSELPEDVPDRVFVDRYDVVGSTVFSPERLTEVTAPYAGREITFAELLQARTAVTQLYVDAGYITSGAYIPPQTLTDGVVVIQVLEGRLEEINVSGTERLAPGYVRSRLALAGAAPLNVPKLLEGLQLLQLNPLIQTISADLQAGVSPGTSVLEVQVTEANTFDFTVALDNARSPSVGSFERQFTFSEGNLLGLGDRISLGYTNTDGSNDFDGSYVVPVNPRNGTLGVSVGFTGSEVIEPPFEVLEISAESRYYELTYRQPVVETPNQEFALGLTLSRQESQTELGIEDIGPFPLSPGADGQGRTRITALRFFQEWTKRSSQQVLAARSQFSVGLDLFDPTINEDEPDSRFFAWRGQGQWVRLLAADTLLLVRGDVQLADAPLVPLEQFGLGGQQTVRGYRQDFLLTDNGAVLSAEVRVPVLRVPEVEGLLQVAPFFDIGAAWNTEGTDPEDNTLLGTGLGFLWQQGDNFSARLDWGFPLVDVDARERTWQEDGIYFSVVWTVF